MSPPKDNPPRRPPRPGVLPNVREVDARRSRPELEPELMDATAELSDTQRRATDALIQEMAERAAKAERYRARAEAAEAELRRQRETPVSIPAAPLPPTRVEEGLPPRKTISPIVASAGRIGAGVTGFTAVLLMFQPTIEKVALEIVKQPVEVTRVEFAAVQEENRRLRERMRSLAENSQTRDEMILAALCKQGIELTSECPSIEFLQRSMPRPGKAPPVWRTSSEWPKTLTQKPER